MTEKKVTSWKKAADVIERTIDGEKVLLDMKTGVYYSLNETGSMIWELLGKPSTAEEITVKLLEAYGGERKTVLCGVNGLLRELKREKLAESGVWKE